MIVRALFVLCLFVTPSHAADQICKTLAAHTPVAGVEYTGDHAVSADLNAVVQPVLAPVRIPITVDLVERYNLDVPDGFELEPSVAMVDIYSNGRVLYNGQDLSGRAKDICAKGPVMNGHAGADTVKSEPQLIEVKEGVYGEALEGEYSE